MNDQNERPLRVVRGEPTEDELAALTVVLGTKAAQAEQRPERPSTWAAYWRSVRQPLRPGPGAWRASAGPR